MRNGLATASLLAVVALIVGSAAYASCCIPPRHALVVTSCGHVEAVYVTTKKGFLKYDGPIAVRMAQYVPSNKRVDSGCAK